MKKKIYITLALSLSFAICCLFIYTFISSAHARIDASGLAGLNVTLGTAFIQKAAGGLIAGILGFAGALTFTMIVYGGFTVLISRGNETMITKGKNMIIWASIGGLFTVLSYAFLVFVIQSIQGQGSFPGTAIPLTGGTSSQPAGSYGCTDVNGQCIGFDTTNPDLVGLSQDKYCTRAAGLTDPQNWSPLDSTCPPPFFGLANQIVLCCGSGMLVPPGSPPDYVCTTTTPGRICGDQTQCATNYPYGNWPVDGCPSGTKCCNPGVPTCKEGTYTGYTCCNTTAGSGKDCIEDVDVIGCDGGIELCCAPSKCIDKKCGEGVYSRFSCCDTTLCKQPPNDPDVSDGSIGCPAGKICCPNGVTFCPTP